jgi:hypothetical protein
LNFLNSLNFRGTSESTYRLVVSLLDSSTSRLLDSNMEDQ